MNKVIRRHAGIEIGEEDVLAWEAGERGMTAVESSVASKVCFYPWNALLKGASLAEEPLNDFRSPPGGAIREVDYKTHQHLHQFGRLCELLSEFSRHGLADAETLGLPVASWTDSEQVVAQRLRDALGINADMQRTWQDENEALEVWKSLASDAGIFVFSLPLNIAQVRGASRWDAGTPPAVLISTSDTPSARIFTLAHELAHLAHRPDKGVMCDPSTIVVSQTIETRMNRIAAKTLVPEGWLRSIVPTHPSSSVFKDWPIQDRKMLTNLFSVSSQMMGIRLKELGIVADHGYESSPWGTGILRRSPGSASVGRGLRSSERWRNYLGEKTITLIRQALDEEQVSIGELTKIYIDAKPEVLIEAIEH